MNLASESRKRISSESLKNYCLENWFEIAFHGTLLSMILFFNSTYAKPTDPFMQEVQAYVTSLGMLAIMLNLVLQTVFLTFTNLVRGIAISFALYSFVLWLFGQYADRLKEWIDLNPTDAVIICISATVVIAIQLLSSKFSPSVDNRIVRPAVIPSSIAQSRTPPKPTQRDCKYIAAHEAGHALVYAALGALPPEIKVAINEHESRDGVLGYVSGIYSAHRLNEKIFTEWSMLVMLAGRVGENIAFGQNTSGSANDNQRWLEGAKSYLSNHFDGIFYIDPKNEFEFNRNEENLEQLRKKQLEMLSELFSLNLSVFKALSETLLAAKVLTRNDLIPFLEKVEIPNGFPQPLGLISDFKREFPAESGYSAWVQ